MLTMYEAVLCFFIYAILGWCVEVIYATVNSGKFVNRGFLNGPYCPIYGFGVLIVVLCLSPVSGSLIPLFFGSVVLDHGAGAGDRLPAGKDFPRPLVGLLQ